MKPMPLGICKKLFPKRLVQLLCNSVSVQWRCQADCASPKRQRDDLAHFGEAIGMRRNNCDSIYRELQGEQRLVLLDGDLQQTFTA